MLAEIKGANPAQSTIDACSGRPAALLREMLPYAGHVVVGRDLEVY
jgi:hypothetical protein